MMKAAASVPWFCRLVLLLLLVLQFSPEAKPEDWPCWRGPRLDGTSLDRQISVHWNRSSNIVWTAALPGAGHASPIVTGGKVLTVTSLADSHERVLLCLDKNTGRLLWQTTVLQASLERKHPLNSFASSTPASDGRTVFVAFLDRDQMFVAAYDLNGKQTWAVRPGVFQSMHGFCSSPILYKGKLLLNGDHDGDSYLLALDPADGRTLWKTPRQNHTRSYCAPLVREILGRDQMILSGDKCVASYDPNTGKQWWVIDGPTEQFVASPVYSAKTGLVYITGGFPDHHILAIRPDGTGNVTQTHIKWRTTQGAAYVPSPIIEGDFFLIAADSGVAHAFEATSGENVWKQRFGEQHASLVSAAGNVYFLNDKGVTHVVRPGAKCEVLATNELGEKCFASPALSDGRMYIRGETNLFCIGNAKGPR